MEDEGGIMIPELASDKSQAALTLRELLIEESSKPFKIMRGPLLRVKLVRVSKLRNHPFPFDNMANAACWQEA